MLALSALSLVARSLGRSLLLFFTLSKKSSLTKMLAPFSLFTAQQRGLIVCLFEIKKFNNSWSRSTMLVELANSVSAFNLYALTIGALAVF